MKVQKHNSNKPHANIQKTRLGNLNGKKVKINYFKLLEKTIVATTAVFGATLASRACYTIFLETSFQSPLTAIGFSIFSLSAVGLGGILGGGAGALVFNPIHF